MKKNYNPELVAGAAIRDDKGRRISKLFEASHPKMTVGYAKNLIMPDDPTEQEFNFRQSGGGVIEDGVAVIDKVKGRSVVWNQAIKSDFSNVTKFRFNFQLEADGSISLTPTDVGAQFIFPKGQFIIGHIYYSAITYKGTSGTIFLNGVRYKNGQAVDANYVTIKGVDKYAESPEGTNIYGDQTDARAILSVKRMVVIDLTQMFGAGNEPSTYEEFLSRKPKMEDEYAYNEGTIVSNNVEAVKTTGVNLFDEDWESGAIESSDGSEVANANYKRMKEMLSVYPNIRYYLAISNAAYGYLYFYDKNKAYLGREKRIEIPQRSIEFTVPDNAYYVRLTVQNAIAEGNVNINLSDPTINGKYFPYEEHTLALDWVKEIKDENGVALFPDGLRSAGAAFDEVRSGKAVKRLGVKILKGLSFTMYTDAFFAEISDFKGNANKNISCSRYKLSTNYGFGGEDKSIAVGSSNKYIYIKDSSYTTLEAFMNSLTDNDLIVYELATPIEVEYDEKNLTYPVVAGGTEEAIASEPSSAFRADIGYGIDAVKTILDLRARVKALEEK